MYGWKMGGPHVSAVQIQLVAWIGSTVYLPPLALVVVVVEGPLLLASGLAGKIFLGTVRSGFGASVHLLGTGRSRPRRSRQDIQDLMQVSTIQAMFLVRGKIYAGNGCSRRSLLPYRLRRHILVYLANHRSSHASN